VVFGDPLGHLDEAEVLIIVTHDIEAIRKRAWERIAMDIGFHFLLVNRDRAFARDEMAEVVVGDKDFPDLKELDPITQNIEVGGIEMLIERIEFAPEDFVAPAL
jgi:hypothetical protein